MSDIGLPPPPRQGDILFRSDRDMWSVNACMNPGDEFPYREGYRRGARQLIEYVCSENRDQDFLVHPIIYLYRHHVELVLKRLLPLAADLAGEELSEKCSRDLDQHRIDELWNNLKPFLKKEKIRKHCGVAIAADDFAGISSYIQQLSKIDPDAQAFRYSHRKTGEASSSGSSDTCQPCSVW